MKAKTCPFLAISRVALASLLGLGAGAYAADGVFSSAAIGGGNQDANVGLSSSKTYLNAVNTQGGALTINGVGFEASSGANPSGTNYSITGVPNTYPGPGGTNNVVGQIGSLLNNFIYAGNPSNLTLNNLTAGKTYSLAFYNRAWGGPRVQNITTTGGATTAFDQDFNTVGDLSVLRYTFTASGTSEQVTFSPQGPASFHFYGFATEQVFNKTWSSGADWTTAIWSAAGAPNSVGANASFTAQGAPTAINLDADQTVGHLQFDGANAWTLSSSTSRRLILQADVGAVSVLAAGSGTHTISTAVNLNSGLLKTGGGTVVLTGAVTDTGKGITLGAGALEFGNTSAQSLTSAIGGSGSLKKSGPGTLTLTGANTYTGATTVTAGTLKIQTGGTPLLTDNFTATGNPNTYNLNHNITNRQTGAAATQNWTPTGNTQVGNPTPVQQPSGTNGDYLLLAFNAQAKLDGLTLSAGNVAGPVKINFDMFKGNTSNPTNWTSFTLTGSGNGHPVAGSGEFGFLYRKNTGIQIFNNSSLVEDFGSSSGNDSFAFYLADSAGTGSPFAGNGTRVIVTQGGSILGSYALNTGMGNRKIAFGSDGSMIGGVDNLAVNNFKTNVLDPAMAVSLTAGGATLELDGAIQTVASLSGVSGSLVNLGPFSRLTVNGPDSTSFAGVISGTLAGLGKAGSGTLTLSGPNTYTGTTSVTGGTLLVNGTHTGGGLTTASGSSTLGGTGSLGAVSILDATLAPGATASPGAGTFTITGGLTLAPASILAFDLAGTTEPADDFVAVTGNLALAGKLTVRPLAGFVPVIGNKWPLMSSSVTPTGSILPADIITVPSTPPPSGSRYEVQVIGNVVYLVVQDTENPVARCQNVTVTLDANGNGSTTAAAVNNGSSDNSLAFTLSLSKTDFTCANIVPGGVPVILKVTDAAGNFDTCTATVTVEDKTAPQITLAASSQTVECDGAGNAAQLNAWLTAHGGATASDACPGVTWSHDFTGLSDGCGATGSATVTFTATDASGNRSQTTATFTIVDTLGPVITIADAVVEYGSPTDPAATGTATALDNCSGTRDVNFSDVVVESDTACHLGTQVVMKITRTWSAEDACGNPTTKDQTIWVMDTRTPRLSILTPAEVTVECSTSAMTPVPVVTPAPEGTTRIPATLDNPAPVPAVMSFVDVTEPGGDSCAYTVTRTWTVTDQGCNTVTFVQKIHVTDTSRPTVTVPPTATVPSGSPQDIDPMVTGQPTATDACDATPTLTYKDSPGVQVGDCSQNYDITRTWTATDDCGNVHTGQQIIQVRVPMPVITLHPVDQTTTLGGTATFTVAVSDACGVRYQWLRNGLAISGATGPSYTVASAHPLDNGAQYWCQVSRDATSLLSDAATLTLTGPSQGSAAIPPMLTITPPRPGGADLVVSFPTEPGFLYHLQGRPSMDVDDWINLGDEFMGTGGIIEVEVPIESVPSGVFRLLVVPYLGSP